MSSIWALDASSTSPMACGPSERESQIRIKKPRTRTKKCEALSSIVCLISVRMTIKHHPARNMTAFLPSERRISDV